MVKMEIKLYTYSELSEQAKSKPRDAFMDGDWRNDNFNEFWKVDLSELYPNSDLKLQYDFSYGTVTADEVNIYGELSFVDILDNWNATDKEKRTIEFYFEHIGDKIELATCNIDGIPYIVEQTEDELKYLGYRGIKTGLLEKFYLHAYQTMQERESEILKDGESYFYEPDEEEITDFYDCNETLFFKDGTVADKE